MRVRLLGLKNNGMAKFWNRCQCLYFCDYAIRFHFGNRIALRCRRLKIACVNGSWKGLLRNLWLDFVSHHRSREQSKQKLALIRAFVICQRRKDFLFLRPKKLKMEFGPRPKDRPGVGKVPTFGPGGSSISMTAREHRKIGKSSAWMSDYGCLTSVELDEKYQSGKLSLYGIVSSSDWSLDVSWSSREFSPMSFLPLPLFHFSSRVTQVVGHWTTFCEVSSSKPSLTLSSEVLACQLPKLISLVSPLCNGL